MAKPSANPKPFTAHERLDAFELLLEQLLVLLEVEPNLNRQTIGAWLQVVRERMRSHQMITARQQVAFGQLAERVLGERDHGEPGEQAQRVARSALGKASRRRT